MAGKEAYNIKVVLTLGDTPFLLQKKASAQLEIPVLKLGVTSVILFNRGLNSLMICTL